MKNKILLHRTFFAGYGIEMIFKKALDFGYDGVEVKILDSDLKAGIKTLAEMKKRYKLKEIRLVRNGDGVFCS